MISTSKKLRDPKDVMIGDRTLAKLLDDHLSGLYENQKVTLNLKDTDLRNVDLRGINLREVNISGAYLSGADLSEANLYGVNLSRANLRGANLEGANLIRANLSETYLRGANLEGANLIRANLSETYLRGANLEGANLRGADLKGTNLREAILSRVNLDSTKFDKSLDLKLYKIPNLDQKVADLVGNGDNLDMELYHSSCGTQHCRAGYAVLAAEAAGKNLEDEIGTSAAAALIYHASTGCVPDFFASYNNALADIRECVSRSN